MIARLLVAITLLSVSLTTFAQDSDVVENPLNANLTFATGNIAAGGNGTLRIDVSLVPHHKAYVDMFKLKWLKPADVKIGAIDIQPKVKTEDKFSKKIREIVKDQSTISAQFEIPENLPAGKHPVELELTYQACSESYCLFPKTLSLKADLTIVPSPTSLRSNDASTTASTFEEALARGTFYTFFFVFIAGILTSLTPCIFPMIPITLAVIGARASERGRLANFLVSLSYVFGIATTYSTLGLIAAKTGALFGSALGSPVVAAFIAFVFVVMALSMYGAFELQLPAFISQRLSNTKTNSGYVGAFITGLITGIVASPCVGPVLVSLLTYVARTQNLVLGFSLLFVFALGIGQLFLVLGTFSNLVQKLPKSGPWMNSVKFIFGTTMVGAALYYLRPVLPVRALDALFGLSLVLISGAFGAFDSAQKTKTTLLKVRKAFMLSAFIMGMAFGIRGTLGLTGGFWNQITTGSPEAEQTYKKLPWMPYSDAALQEAHSQNRPVIIDFWAEWCLSCKELEVLTFTDSTIQEEAKKFLLLKIDATNDNEEIKRLKNYYRVLGLPTMIFYSPGGKLRPDLTLTGFEKAPEFLVRMKKAELGTR